MFKIDNLGELNDNELQRISLDLTEEDINNLVLKLDDKANKERCQALFLLKYRSYERNDVYPYMDNFIKRLNSKDSTQRSIGCMLMAANAKWDDKKIDENIELYLSITEDEKPITSRQCIQALLDIVPYKEKLWNKIIDKLININIKKVKATMRKLIVIDSINVLKIIDKNNDKINNYFDSIVKDNIFDDKIIKEINKSIMN